MNAMPACRRGTHPRPSRRLALQVAASLDAPAPLLPVLPLLLADLPSLGGNPRSVVRALQRAGVSPRRSVIDVGCGKGATGVELARAVGCEVLGVDAFGPFLESARALASRRGVAHLCRFRSADLRSVRGRFDVALMLGVRPLGEAATLLHRLTRPGGLYALDDAVRLGRLPPDVRALTPDQADALIESSGDRVVERSIMTPSAVRRLNACLYRRLARRAAEIAEEQPRLRAPLAEFLRRQRRSNRLLAGPLRPALWVVRRGPGA